MKRILYLGLEVPNDMTGKGIVHYPIIRIIPKSKEDQEIKNAFSDFDAYTHLLLTSKSAITIFFEYAPFFNITLNSIRKKSIIVVGRKSAERIRQYGAEATTLPRQETAEGIIASLEHQNLRDAYLFWPHSALARPVLQDWLQQNQIKYRSSVFYQTINHAPFPPPELSIFDEIIFTSPSTIDAFLCTYKAFPEGKTLTCIGPITQKYLDELSPQLLFI